MEAKTGEQLLIDAGVSRGRARQLGSTYSAEEIAAVIAEKRGEGGPGLIVHALRDGEGAAALARKREAEARQATRQAAADRAAREAAELKAERMAARPDELRLRIVRETLNRVREWAGRCKPDAAAEYRAGLGALEEVFGDDESIAHSLPYPIEHTQPETRDDDIFDRMVEAARAMQPVHRR